MNRLELFNIIRPIVVAITGVPVCILSNPNAPAPEGDYCSVEPFQNLQQIGRGVVKTKDIPAVDEDLNFLDTEETLITLVEATTNINFYRGAAQDYAHKLFFSDQRSDVHESLFSQGVGWMGNDPVNNLTTLNSGVFEPRSQINIRFRFEQTQTNTVQQIYTVATEIQDEFGNVLVSGN